MTGHYPCGTPKPDTLAKLEGGGEADPRDAVGPPIVHKSVMDVKNFWELFTMCMPAFLAGQVRELFEILDAAIGKGVTFGLAVAGPWTASGQWYVWGRPLLLTGWIDWVSTTDAAVYHDTHRAMEGLPKNLFRSVPMYGAAVDLHEKEEIEITDIAMPGDALYTSDRFFSTLLRQPDFQKKMSGMTYRNLVGKYLKAEEMVRGVEPGMLVTCHDQGIPIAVGGMIDGSSVLNIMKLRKMSQAGLIPEFKFEFDPEEEIWETCAIQNWGVTDSPSGQMGVWILGGGVPKNFMLQAAPANSQILCLEIDGYRYDVQIVIAPISDGALSGCPGDEAHTWDKVEKEAIAPEAGQKRTVISLNSTDYSPLMPFIVKALLEKRKMFLEMIREHGEDEVYKRHPEARGYCRPQPHRLYDRLPELKEKLRAAVFDNSENLVKLMKTMDYSLELVKNQQIPHP